MFGKICLEGSRNIYINMINLDILFLEGRWSSGQASASGTSFKVLRTSFKN